MHANECEYAWWWGGGGADEDGVKIQYTEAFQFIGKLNLASLYINNTHTAYICEQCILL